MKRILIVFGILMLIGGGFVFASGITFGIDQTQNTMSLKDRVITTGNGLFKHFSASETWTVSAACTIKSISCGAYSAAGSTSKCIVWINTQDDTHCISSATCVGLATASVSSYPVINDVEIYLEAGDKIMVNITVAGEAVIIGKYR